jgi:glycine/D-amino acid oxidase-like deaminating enzyme
MRQPLDRIETDTEFCDHADVVVIGGGIAGVSAAYFLAKKGLSVVVLEKGLVAAEQSSRNWGWVRQQGRDEAELDLMRRSMTLWNHLPEEIGQDFGFRKNGVLFVTQSAAELQLWADWREMAIRHDVESQLLSPLDVERRLRSGGQRWIGGLFTPSDGCAEPSKVVPALAQAARQRGVRVYQNCAARVLDIEGGRVRGVVTERGLVKADNVLGAGGVWSSMFCRRHRVRLPQAVVYGSVLRATVDSAVFSDCLSTPTFSARASMDGTYIVAISGHGTVHITPSLIRNAWNFIPLFMERRKGLKIRFGKAFFNEILKNNWDGDTVSPFEKTRILDPAPDLELLGRALATFRAGMPGILSIEPAAEWGGAIDSLADALPVISPVPSLPGFFLSTGYSGHGFGIGFAAGELAADLIAGDRPGIDPFAFRYRRLIDGTRLRPGGVA